VGIIVPSQAALLLCSDLRLFSRMKRVSNLVWLLLVPCSLSLSLHLLLDCDLLHCKFLTYLLLGSPLNSILGLFRAQVILTVIYCVLAVGESINSRLLCLIISGHRLLLGCVLVRTSYTSSRFWRLTSSQISLLVLVGVEGRDVVKVTLLLLFKNVVSFYKSFDFWFPNIIEPTAGKAVNSGKSFYWVKCKRSFQKF
jgi:hypothetical protein